MKKVWYVLSMALILLIASCQSDNPSMITLGLDDTYVVERMKGLTLHPGFIKFCDAFEIPVLTITNTTGFKADTHSERCIAKAAAQLTYAFANATVPKVNVIAGKAYGSAYTVMNSKALGADMTFAWENAEIGMMDAKSGSQDHV